LVLGQHGGVLMRLVWTKLEVGQYLIILPFLLFILHIKKWGFRLDVFTEKHYNKTKIIYNL
jgi:hypothetical protein